LVLASVLAVAGVAKLFDRAGSEDAVRAFGVPPRAVGAVVHGLPVLELAIAAALVPAQSARWAAATAALLFVLFGAGIARALAAGRSVDCRCFGQLSQAPAGRAALGRNAVLAGLAGFTALGSGAPGPAIGTWLSQRTEAQLVAFWLGAVLVVVIAAAGWFGRELLREHGRLMLRIDALEGGGKRGGLPVGAPAPAFSVKGWPSGELSLKRLLASRRPAVLVFSDAQCGPCAAAVPVIAAAQRKAAGRATVAVISKGHTPESERAWREHRLEHLGITDDHDIAASYGAFGFPTALVLSADGRIDSPIAEGVRNITELLAAHIDGEDDLANGELEALDPDAPSLRVRLSTGGELVESA
jgi:uncharacterized membrane protein